MCRQPEARCVELGNTQLFVYACCRVEAMAKRETGCLCGNSQLRWDLSTAACSVLYFGLLLQASYRPFAQSRLSTAPFGAARDCDSASDFIFTFGSGPARSFRFSAPSGFDHIPAPFPETILSKEFRNKNVSLLLEIDFTLRLIFPFYLSSYYSFYYLFFMTYYIYISNFI